MGQPIRIFNVFLHPTPHSMMFWDIVVLSGYLVLNVVISRVTLTAERRQEPPPRWVKPIILLSIPWAVSHPHRHRVPVLRPGGATVLADRHPGPPLPGLGLRRGPGAADPAGLVVRRLTSFDPGREAIQRLAEIVTYAMIVNVFFVLHGALHRALQRHPGARGPLPVPVPGPGGRRQPGALHVGLDPARGGVAGAAPDQPGHPPQRADPGAGRAWRCSSRCGSTRASAW